MKFMKKTVFCVALVAALFLAVPANAQFKFGPKVGMNISTLSLSGNLSDNFKANNISSFTGGLMAEFMVPVIGYRGRCQFDVYSEGVGIERYNQWYIGE